MMFVPVSLGAAHQAGSLSLLTLTLWLMRELKPRKIVRIIKP
jgi:heme A synthase